MEITSYNTDKGRLVTVEVQFTSAKTTWFKEDDPDGVYSITDIDGDLLIQEPGYRIPLLIQGLSRAVIKHDRDKARELINLNKVTR
ncbi:MAG TPA: hypothetical protein ENK84_13185 [Desulfobulbus sp.]|nr:hypothetical protein [Desulfobulbus sp.]